MLIIPDLIFINLRLINLVINKIVLIKKMLLLVYLNTFNKKYLAFFIIIKLLTRVFKYFFLLINFFKKLNNKILINILF